MREMADLKALAEQIVNLTLLQAQELKQILKDEYGIEPAAGGAVMVAGPAAGGAAAEAAEEKTEFDVVLTDVLAAGAHDPVPVHAIPMLALRGLAVVNPLMREIGELSYMWTRPYVLDSAHTRQTLGLEPTPWDEVCRRTATGNLTPVG